MPEPIAAYLLALPRIAVFTLSLPLLRSPITPPIPRNAVSLVLALLITPALLANPIPPEHNFALLAAKEALIGLMAGFALNLAFLIPQAVGDFIDNQRGASIAAAFEPSLQTQASPLGILLSHAFLLWFLAAGGIQAAMDLLFASYLIYPPSDPFPVISQQNIDAVILALASFLKITMIAASPFVFPMLLSEIALGFAGRFAPQLNVFFLSMPIKSVVAVSLLAIYVAALLTFLFKSSFLPGGFVPSVSPLLVPNNG